MTSKSNGKNRRTLLLVISATCLVLAGGWMFVRYNRKNAFERSQAQRTVKVTKRDIRKDLLLTGKVLPASSIAVYSPVSGQLRQIMVSEGQRVEEKQILFSVQQDSSAQKELEARQSEVERTRLDLQAAQENLDRRKNVRDLFSQLENEKAENDYDRARLAFEAAKQQLSLLEDALGLAHKKKSVGGKGEDRLSLIYVKAPKSGHVTFLNKAVGESVMATAESAEATGREVLIISDTEKMMVRSRILEADLAVVKTGQPVTIKLDAFPNKGYEGVVSRISQQGVEDKAGGFTYFVTDMVLNAPDRDVRAQMNASIELVVAEVSSVLSLPANAVATLNGHSVVELPRQSPSAESQYKKVQTGLTTDLWVEIKGNSLDEGEAVLEIDFAKLDLKKLSEGKLGSHPVSEQPKTGRAD